MVMQTAPTGNVVVYGSLTDTTLTQTSLPFQCEPIGLAIPPTPQYAFMTRVDGGAYGSPTAWSTNNTNAVPISSNHVYTYTGLNRCFIDASNYSNATSSAERTINYQITTPAVSITNGSVVNLGNGFEVLSPFLYTLAICSALGIYYVAYKLILYPWFRRRS